MTFNPEQFDGILYHGTNARLNAGDIIEPRSYNNILRAPAAWASTNPDAARYYGYEKMAINKQPTGAIYRVTPVDPEEKLTALRGDKGYVGSRVGYKVIDVHEELKE